MCVPWAGPRPAGAAPLNQSVTDRPARQHHRSICHLATSTTACFALLSCLGGPLCQRITPPPPGPPRGRGRWAARSSRSPSLTPVGPCVRVCVCVKPPPPRKINCCLGWGAPHPQIRRPISAPDVAAEPVVRSNSAAARRASEGARANAYVLQLTASTILWPR